MASTFWRRRIRRALALLPVLVLAAAPSLLGPPARTFVASAAASHSTGALPPPEAATVQVPLGPCAPAPEAAGTWVYASDVAWEHAETAWPAVADVVVPERDASFSRNPLVVADTTYAKGLGTYPYAEITYALDSQYRDFQALAGLNADSSPDAAVVFLVYADGALVFNSGLVRASAPVPVDVCVAGVRRLRLVTALAGQDAAWIEQRPEAQVATFADWADARLFRAGSGDTATISAAGAIREALDTQTDARRRQIVGELGVYQQAGVAVLQAIAPGMGSDASGAAAWPGATRGFRDAAGRAVLAHRRLAVVLDIGGQNHALLTVVDPRTGAAVLYQAGSAVNTNAGPMLLSTGTLPAAEGPTFERVEDPALGPGTQARVPLRLRGASSGGPSPDPRRVEVRITLYDDQPYFTYQLALDGWSSPSSATAPTRLDYLAAGGAAGVLGDAAGYYADAGYTRSGELADDGLWRAERVGLGKPAAVWGSAVPGDAGQSGTLVVASLDEQRLPAWLVLRRDPAHAAAIAGIAQPLPAAALTGRPADGPPDGHLDGPRVLLHLAGTQDLRAALGEYRRIAAQRNPAAPLPDWVRFQWGSWWVYGSGVTEDQVRRQIDVIAGELSDLGPWHILLDAGWQDLGPGGSDELGQDSRQRFPHGVRALVDYAHARGIKVILFFSAVYAHDGNDKGEWLGLPRLISEHSEWFIPLTAPGVIPARYLFDYANPAAHDYLVSVLRRYVTDYDADGVKIDGLGDAEGELIPFRERVQVYPQRWALTPVMDVYRTVAQTLWALKPDAFIESGWVNPTAAQPYAHTFRSGDEWNVFDRIYPFPGLAQHFSYAAVQHGLLGQRANVGAIYGGLEKPLARQWLGAALATGAAVSLGSDLTALSAEQLATLRAWLAPQRPFGGATHTGPQANGVAPGWAATTYGDTTYLGLLNDTAQPTHREVGLSEAELDAPPGGPMLAYDPESGQAQIVRDAVAATVPPQALQTLVLRRPPGVVWTTSSYEALPAARGWRLALRGPADVPGRLEFYLGGPGLPAPQVRLDGVPLQSESGAKPTGEGAVASVTFDPRTGLLTVRYAHAGLLPIGQPSPARMLEVAP